jgi:hypothetical protein
MCDIGTRVEFKVGRSCLTDDGKTVVFDVSSLATEYGFGVVMETNTNNRGISGKILRVDRFDSDCLRLFAPLNHVDVSKNDFVSFEIGVNKVGSLQAFRIKKVKTIRKTGRVTRSDSKLGVDIWDHELEASLWADCEVCENVFRVGTEVYPVGTEVEFLRGDTRDCSRVVFAFRPEEAFGILTKTADGAGTILRVDVDWDTSASADISTFADGAYVRYKKVEVDGAKRAEEVKLVDYILQRGIVSRIESTHGCIRRDEYDEYDEFGRNVCHTDGGIEGIKEKDVLDYHVATNTSVVFKVWRAEDCLRSSVGIVRMICRNGTAMIAPLDQPNNLMASKEELIASRENLIASKEVLTASRATERDIVKITQVLLGDGRWRVQALTPMPAADRTTHWGKIAGEDLLLRRATNERIRFNPLVSDENYPVGTEVQFSYIDGPQVFRVFLPPRSVTSRSVTSRSVTSTHSSFICCVYSLLLHNMKLCYGLL